MHPSWIVIVNKQLRIAGKNNWYSPMESYRVYCNTMLSNSTVVQPVIQSVVSSKSKEIKNGKSKSSRTSKA
jgi:hypothetical protein